MKRDEAKKTHPPVCFSLPLSPPTRRMALRRHVAAHEAATERLQRAIGEEEHRKERGKTVPPIRGTPRPRPPTSLSQTATSPPPPPPPAPPRPTCWTRSTPTSAPPLSGSE